MSHDEKFFEVMPGVRVRVVLLVKEFYITVSCWVRYFFTRLSATLTYGHLVFASEILDVERSHFTESGFHTRALAIASFALRQFMSGLLLPTLSLETIYLLHLFTPTILTPALLLDRTPKSQPRQTINNPPNPTLPSNDLARRARVTRRHVEARVLREEVAGP